MKNLSLAIFTVAIAGCNCGVPSQAKPVAEHAAKLVAKPPDEIALFDGVSLKNWKETNFGGEGDVEIKNGQLILTPGSPLTGVTWTGPELPKTNYEVTLEAMRVTGNDFFCGIGFPVGNTYASFVAGGWGGGTCGISLIDGEPAIENETFTFKPLPNNKWFSFCLRVTPEKIEVWLDDFPIVDVKITDRQIAIHPAMEPSTPFGLTSYMSTAAYRNVKLRKLD